jgi:hypothetical protein
MCTATHVRAPSRGHSAGATSAASKASSRCVARKEKQSNDCQYDARGFHFHVSILSMFAPMLFRRRRATALDHDFFNIVQPLAVDDPVVRSPGVQSRSRALFSGFSICNCCG